MAIYSHPKTWIDIDRKTGRIRVYLVATGELLYELKIQPCNHS